jgi:hypothetical protein
MAYTYTRELELLIINKLLPAYKLQELAKGIKDPLKDIDHRLLDQITKEKKVPALLKP